MRYGAMPIGCECVLRCKRREQYGHIAVERMHPLAAHQRNRWCKNLSGKEDSTLDLYLRSLRLDTVHSLPRQPQGSKDGHKEADGCRQAGTSSHILTPRSSRLGVAVSEVVDPQMTWAHPQRKARHLQHRIDTEQLTTCGTIHMFCQRDTAERHIPHRNWHRSVDNVCDTLRSILLASSDNRYVANAQKESGKRGRLPWHPCRRQRNPSLLRQC